MRSQRSLPGLLLAITLVLFSISPVFAAEADLSVSAQVDKSEVKQGEPLEIDEEQAGKYLERDLITAEKSICRLISVPLSDNQYDALCSWTFNLGGGALQRSTLRMKLNRGQYEDVPDEIRKWNRVGAKALKGLVRRREAEALLWG